MAIHLFRFPVCAILVYLLDKRECFLLLTVFRDQPLAVVTVLKQRNIPCGRTKVHEHPWSKTTYLRNPRKHHEVVAIEVELELLGPALVFGAMVSGLGFGAEFADDDGLLRKFKLDVIRLRRSVGVPPDVFIDANYIEHLG